MFKAKKKKKKKKSVKRADRPFPFGDAFYQSEANL